MKPHDPGLRFHHDQRNERFLLRDALPRQTAPSVGPALVKPKSRLHRQYAYFDQGQTPECTGYSCVTLLATADPYNKPPLTGHEWYEQNVAFDCSQGRYFDGGATVTAAMEVGRQRGFWQEYRWCYDMRTMMEGIQWGPLICGFRWYPSMFQWGSDKVVKSPGPNETTDEGHQLVFRGYDAKRDLWKHPTTWDVGDLEIPGDLVYRLLREGGEVSQPREIKVVPPHKAAA